MKLRDFLKVLNLQVKYIVTDKFSHEKVEVKENKDHIIYMVFQEEDGTLNIVIY